MSEPTFATTLDEVLYLRSRVQTLEGALRPFADFADTVEQFVEQRAADGGSPLLPTNHFRLADFKRAQTAIKGTGRQYGR